MNNSTLAQLCIKSEEESEGLMRALEVWFHKIRVNADNNEQYRETLTNFNAPLEMQYAKKQGEKNELSGYRDRMQLCALAKSVNHKVRKALAGFQYAPDEALRYLANNPTFFEKSARSQSKSYDEIENAEYADIEIATNVAGNPNASPYTLYVLTNSIIDKCKKSSDWKLWSAIDGYIRHAEELKERYTNGTQETCRKLSEEERLQSIREFESEIERDKKDKEEGRRAVKLDNTIGRVIRAIVSNKNTPNQTMFIINRFLNDAECIKAYPNDTDNTISAIPLNISSSLERINNLEGIVDESMKPYLEAYCYNIAFINGHNGEREVYDIEDYLRGKKGEKEISEQATRIGKACTISIDPEAEQYYINMFNEIAEKRGVATVETLPQAIKLRNEMNQANRSQQAR